MNPSCDVFTAMTQISALLIPAITHPSQRFFPTRIVEVMVKTQEI
jgi:hypothetical protein